MNKAKKFFYVTVEVTEDFGSNGCTWGNSPIRVEDGKVALAWNDRGCLEWWGNSSGVRNDETFELDEKVRGIVEDHLRNKPLWWWNKAFAAAAEKGSFDLRCRLPNREYFAIRAAIDCVDSDELEDWPEDEYAGFVKFLGAETENATAGEEEAE